MVAQLRGPDSSRDELMLDRSAVFPETVDVNIRQLDPIPAPRTFLKELPLTASMSSVVLRSRQEIRDVLHGDDDRLLVIVGPCSILRTGLSLSQENLSAYTISSKRSAEDLLDFYPIDSV